MGVEYREASESQPPANHVDPRPDRDGLSGYCDSTCHAGNVSGCRWCIPTLAAVNFLCLAVLAYWEFVDYSEWNPFGGKAVSYYEAHAAPSVVKSGDITITRWRYQVHRDCPRTVSLFAANVPVTVHGGVTRGKRMIVPATLERPVRIPELVQPGRHVIRVVSEFRCNPLRHEVASADIPIVVLPADDHQ